MLHWIISAACAFVVLWLIWRLDKIRHHHEWSPWGNPQECNYKGKMTVIQVRTCSYFACKKSQVRPL